MKTSRVLMLLVLALLFTSLAFADGVDPKIIIRGIQGGGAPGFAHCPPQGCSNVGTNFTFTVPDKGRGTLFFTNTSGKNWTSLKLVEKGVPAANITCAQNLFLSCSVKTLDNGSVEILLTGINKGKNPRIGILAGQSFAIGFACVNGNCWPGGLTFTAHAGTAPEPGTIALLLTGAGALYSKRKRWLKDVRA